MLVSGHSVEEVFPLDNGGKESHRQALWYFESEQPLTAHMIACFFNIPTQPNEDFHLNQVISLTCKAHIWRHTNMGPHVFL